MKKKKILLTTISTLSSLLVLVPLISSCSNTNINNNNNNNNNNNSATEQKPNIDNSFNIALNNLVSLYANKSKVNLDNAINEINLVNENLQKNNNSYVLSFCSIYFPTKTNILKNPNNQNYDSTLSDIIKKIYNFSNILYYNNNDVVNNFLVNLFNDLFNNYYYANISNRIGNWWNWEIGIPKELIKNLCLIYKCLDQQLIKKYLNEISCFALYKDWYIGGNLADNILINICINIMLKDSDKINHFVNLFMNKSFTNYQSYKNKIINSGSKKTTYDNGFFQDGSFLEHNGVAYMGAYGVEFIKQFNLLCKILLNTQWSFFNKDIHMFYDIIEYSIMPYMFEMSYTDILCGRSVARINHDQKINGAIILNNLVIFAENAPIEYKSRLIEFIINQIKSYANSFTLINKYHELVEFYNKYKNNNFSHSSRIGNNWNELNYYNSLYTYNPDNNNFNMPKGIDLFNITHKQILSKIQDSYCFQNTNYAFNLKLNSKYNKFFESSNNENTFGYYQSDGLYLIENHNKNNYTNNYWKTVDPFKLPGTSSLYEYDNSTISNQPEKIKANTELAKKTTWKTTNNHANGLMVDDLSFISANINNYNDCLNTKKLYIKIQDVYLVLGKINIINNINNYDIYTTITNDISNTPIKTQTINILDHQYNEYISNDNSYIILNNDATIISNSLLNRKINSNVTGGNDNKVLTNNFNEIYYKHSSNNNLFCYLIKPNYITNKTNINELIQSLQYNINDDYIKVEFNYNNNPYCFISTFNDNILVNINNNLNITAINFSKPTSLLLKQDNISTFLLSSSNEYDLNNKYNLNLILSNTNFDFECLNINNKNEIDYNLNKINNNLLLNFNDIYYNNDKQHNSWAKITFK